MKLGYIGLGKMGFNMVERLLEKGHRTTVFDRNRTAIEELSAKGAQAAGSIKALAQALETPRLVWIMVPYSAVDAVLSELVQNLAPGDVVIEGGNSPYKESIRRAGELEKKGIDYLDVGVSGGPDGARRGACIMVGGNQEVYRRIEELLRDLATEGGYGYMGGHGTGHFVKMVHNGIEYGMMQALAEGFAVMKESGFELDLTAVAGLYNRRSVIESRLVGWLRDAYAQYDRNLDGISGSVAQSGEGKWTVEAARELGVPVPIIEGALEFRLQSQKEPSYTGRIISALRNRFGGHVVKE